MFEIVTHPIDPVALRDRVLDPAAGGFCSFEGWVRNHHQGRAVEALEYEAYATLAEKEGARIIAEAAERFDIHHAVCQHHVGRLDIGGLAVVVCVSASH
ncbi:molybdenum cofactor biosynthesis protein MoaE, partial [Luteolibacter marinus]|uniref:molybdenum cofactor biosynthesis protein MoaE n=1 Tax=Luteolibacter marinus TaxID=2776705 RepID=UPI001868C573